MTPRRHDSFYPNSSVDDSVDNEQINWINRARGHDYDHSPLSRYGNYRSCDYSLHCRHGKGHGYHEPSTSDSTHKPKTDLKTKDVALRGKAYKIRKNFLADMGKFEGDLIKFVDKKSEEELPNGIIQMLVDYINQETCKSRDMVDLVGLNVLSSNLGYKSAVEASLSRLKDIASRYNIGTRELTKICGTITMSAKVDDRIKLWLKKFIIDRDIFQDFCSSKPFRELLKKHPEVGTRLEVILGFRDTEDELDFPVI